MNKELVNALLSIGIQLLTKLIPALGGGFLGLILGWAIPWLSGLLYAWIARLAGDAVVDANIADAKAKQLTKDAIKKDPNATPAQIEKALSDWELAVRDLGRLRLR